MPGLHELSDLQLAVLQALWRVGPATAADVRAEMERTNPLAITTVSTLLTRLEQRGVVSHVAEGRTHYYRATVTQTAVRRAKLTNLVRGLFAGDSASVLSQLVDERSVSDHDLDRMRAMIDDAKRGRPAKPTPRRSTAKSTSKSATKSASKGAAKSATKSRRAN